MKIRLFALAFVCTIALPSTLAIEEIIEFGEFRVLKSGMMKQSPLTPKRHEEGNLDLEDKDFWDPLQSMSMSFPAPTAPPVNLPTPSILPSRMPITVAPGCPGCPTATPALSDAPSFLPSSSPTGVISPPPIARTLPPTPSISMTTRPTMIRTMNPATMMSKRPTASRAPVSASPVAAPTSAAPVPTISPATSMLPTITSSPITTPTSSLAPTVTQSPTNAGPTKVPCDGPCFEVVFRCSSENVVVEAAPPARSTIDFNVGYVVESTALLEEFIEQLEAMILETAVQGALQCGEGGPLFGPGGTRPQILMFTSMTGDECVSEVENSVCVVLETKFQILVKKNLNPDLGAFLGYMDLQTAMDNGTFVEAIPELDRIEYLKPLPLLPPITGPSPAPSPIAGEASQVSVSSWTIGAVVAMCVGGTIAIAAWARNRRTRNQRHMQLLEEMSSTSPSAPIANTPEQPASVAPSSG